MSKESPVRVDNGLDNGIGNQVGDNGSAGIVTQLPTVTHTRRTRAPHREDERH